MGKKTMENRKMLTEKKIIEQLRKGKIFFPPLSFRFIQKENKGRKSQDMDALIEASWGKNKVKFAVECKALSTPKIFRDGLNRLKTSLIPKDYNPLLLVPYLNEKQLQELELEGISGIDLCGNGIVIIPNVFAVFRSGEKNRFTSSAPIKNIYRKNSSMVGRVFLSSPIYESVQDILKEINRKNLLVNRWGKKNMSLSTVSKVLKILEEDLILSREDNIRLIQADRLLEKLSENYDPKNIYKRIHLKVPLNIQMLQDYLVEKAKEAGIPLVANGISSIGRYAVMQRGEILSVYCPQAEKLLDRIKGNPSDRFPNLEILETEDETYYFDAQKDGNFWWASPVQVYLELMKGDKRDRETAEQVKSYIINNIMGNT
ncbi:MAG: hypothetical protein JXL81_05525 [Deltaproteobacteria bacterium]|nr:hypothetical protein [Deltaproteobacteria bacterium]